MDVTGLSLCTRYSYPPNSLSLCGPDKQEDLRWYSGSLQADKGTVEILTLFSTLYPYLRLIAEENKISDPFDKRVVEAYWIGNQLLKNIPLIRFARHLSDKLLLRKKMKIAELEKIMEKLVAGGLPYHAFHVTNIYKRTGHLNTPHTVETMDACIINWGKIDMIRNNLVEVTTQSLQIINKKLGFGKSIKRNLMLQGEKDILKSQLKTGNFISYHWGYVCDKLTSLQLHNLMKYTSLALKLANSDIAL
ncbi:hypothetical protein HY945_05055 [Candidatus Gottesmanbacteria bacterium]|nr:hypothetical protein [Candidatus Gottesmanbacteria bacterium]